MSDEDSDRRPGFGGFQEHCAGFARAIKFRVSCPGEFKNCRFMTRSPQWSVVYIVITAAVITLRCCQCWFWSLNPTAVVRSFLKNEEKTAESAYK